MMLIMRSGMAQTKTNKKRCTVKSPTRRNPSWQDSDYTDANEENQEENRESRFQDKDEDVSSVQMAKTEDTDNEKCEEMDCVEQQTAGPKGKKEEEHKKAKEVRGRNRKRGRPVEKRTS